MGGSENTSLRLEVSNLQPAAILCRTRLKWEVFNKIKYSRTEILLICDSKSQYVTKGIIMCSLVAPIFI